MISRRLFLAAVAAVCAATGTPAAPAPAADPLPEVGGMKLPPLADKRWKKLDNGMRVWDVKEGKGDAVKPGADVTVHYTGWLVDGTVFDSSRKRKESISFNLNGLIKGWQVGIPGMKPGGVRLLEIPYDLGYGERGSPPVIPPKATLIFEIEVLPTK